MECVVNTIMMRREENAPGKYFVTHDCDGCGNCYLQALANFMYSCDSTYFFVYRQPVNEREERDVRRAMSMCPMHCIRDDGEPN